MTTERRRDAATLTGIVCVLASLYLVWLPLALFAVGVLCLAWSLGGVRRRRP